MSGEPAHMLHPRCLGDRPSSPITRETSRGRAKKQCLHGARDCVAILRLTMRCSVNLRRTRDDEHDRRAQVLRSRLRHLLRARPLLLLEQGRSLPQSRASLPSQHGKPPWPRAFVIRCPLSQLAQTLDQFRWNTTFDIHAQARSALLSERLEGHEACGTRVLDSVSSERRRSSHPIILSDPVPHSATA